MATKPIYVLNGPNLDQLGKREPEIYGTTSLADIEAALTKRAQAAKHTLVFQQSNDEGALVESIHEAGKSACALILNAAAYTHTSVALLDALKTLTIPVIEVHLSNIFQRESFRHHSYVSPAALGIICGFGAHSYYLALEAILTQQETK